jgi:hypothetical protein
MGAKRSPALLLLLAIVLPPWKASASGPVGFELGAKVGYGTSINGPAVSPLGIGFGGRAGITFFGVYLGLDVVDYLGTGDGNGGDYHAFQFGGELGYGFRIRAVTIRPQVGVGDVYLFGSVAGLTSPAFPPSLCLFGEPGITVLVSFGRVYIGLDAGALLILNEPAYVQSGSQYTLTTGLTTAVTTHAQIGIKF